MVTDETYVTNRPLAWQGTDDERDANYASHRFAYDGDPADGDARCTRCDCRQWGTIAGWPCDAPVPREVFTFVRNADGTATRIGYEIVPES